MLADQGVHFRATNRKIHILENADGTVFEADLLQDEQRLQRELSGSGDPILVDLVIERLSADIEQLRRL